ncbi:MAG: SDR family oxidoreductase [Acidobacteria bacterium]|nr:SDR family oxidoreductase [Acidobacteriota bacterium]MCZ6876659.1 SDR family oxidoreductase [Acidobacteriota bacterium]
MKHVLILGATSSIARAMASVFAREGAKLFLGGRDLSELKHMAADLGIRYGISVHCGRVDAEDFAAHEKFLENAIGTLEEIHGVVFAIGYLGEQPRESADPETALKIININLSAAVSLLAPIANLLEEQGHGFIMGFSSVAGDRARQSNYVYGAAKGGLSLYLDGLRNRLDRQGVKVFTLKLGFVDTEMTYGKRGLFLVASPEQVARIAWQMLQKPSGIYYIPRFWRIILLVIRLIPESVFKRLKL